ncbi:MAG: riboflavin synthase [Vulcanimicrobiaceae bacterium]
MFSGLIGYRGRVVGVERDARGGMLLRVDCEGAAEERPQPKDSIAVNGVCLTATSIDDGTIGFDVIPETLGASTTGDRRVGDIVNIEYSLRMGDRLGGHFVYGHIDAPARVIVRTPEGRGERIRIERPAELAPMIAQKAFIAVDGISLTVAAVGDGWFEIALIPETIARTTLSARPAGSKVNLEVDPLARYAYAAAHAFASIGTVG